MELGRLIGPELRNLLTAHPGQAREIVDELHPQDVADGLGELEDEEVAQALRSLPVEYSAQVFERLEEERQVLIAKRLGVESTVALVREMDADDAVDFFDQLPEETVRRLLHRLQSVSPETAEDVRELQRWDETSAGGLMTNEFVSVPAEFRVEEALLRLRQRAAEGVEVLQALYVIDEAGHVSGYVTLRRLLMSSAELLISEIAKHNLLSVPPEMDQEEVARTFARYDLHALPVVNAEEELLGIITSDDVIDVFEEEAEEDAQKMGAIEPIEGTYFSASRWTYFQKRAPWLVVLFIGGFFTTSAMKAFGPVLQSITALAFYLPLLISAGGNSGSQSATLIIRGLAVGEIQARDWWRVLARELFQGLTLGLMLATIGFLRAYGGGDGLGLALLVSVTIITIVTMGCVVGALMPLLLHRIGLDPATSSTPFIASLVDVLGIVVYLGLARLLLTQLDQISPLF